MCLPEDAALVLGSAQGAADFDDELVRSAGLGVVRRRSGGGAVLVAPGRQLWLDLFLPAGDPLALSDVGKSFLWLGDAYAEALRTVLGTAPRAGAVEVNRGRARATQWSGRLCFAGLGCGEVTVGGRKVVGLSQRRERAGSWFHSMALLSGDAGELAGLLRAAPAERAAARQALAEAGPADAAVPGAALLEALLSRLP